MFSVVLTTHDRPVALAQAIASALGAGRSVAEVLVIDDLGLAATGETVRGFADARLRHVRRDGVPGPAASRNLGVQQARGRYLVFLDDDDAFDAGYLDWLAGDLEALAWPRFCYTNWTERLWTPGAPAPGYLETPVCIPDNHAADILVHNFVAINALTIEAGLARHFRFDERLPSHEDWDWIIGVTRAVPAVPVELFGPIVNIRRDAGRHRNDVADRELGALFAQIYARWPLTEQERASGLAQRRLRQLARRGVTAG